MKSRFKMLALAPWLVACAPAPVAAPKLRTPSPQRRPAPTADKRRVELDAKLAALVGPVLSQDAKRAIGIVVFDEDRARVFGFGRRNSRDSRPPDGETSFEIGSISKGFAGVLLADAVLRGELSLSDPLSKYLPSDIQLRFEPTLEHVATLSAGFPMMPSNWITLDPVTHRTRYALADFRTFLNEFAPPTRPGERFSYSNVDTALLAMALSAKYGVTYAELLRKRLFAPLKMTKSAYADHADPDPNRMEGYDDEDRLRPPRADVSPLGPCCAIRTTLDDIGRFMRGVLPSKASGLSKAFWLASRPRVATGPNPDRYMGFGWVTETRYADASKNGQVEGYRSVLRLFPNQRRGVFVVVNSEKVDADTLASNIVDSLFAPRPAGVGDHSMHVASALPTTATTSSITFDSAIRLEGWTAPACVAPGTKARIAYYYRALRTLDHDWQVFVHGDASKPGVPRLHGDHYPARGRDTTLDWKPGELIVDEIELDVPSSYTANAFTVWTGWYRGNSRLAASGNADEVADDRARGPNIVVGKCR